VKNILKTIWRVLNKPEKKEFCLLMLLDIVISIVDILSLALLVWIIQFYIQPVAVPKTSYLPGWLADRNSLAVITIFFFLFGIKNLAAFFIARAHYRFIARVAIRISRNNLFNYQQAEFEEFINVDSSVHIRRIAFQPFEFCQYMLSGVQQVMTQVCLILIAIIAIVLFNTKLFLLLLCILLPPVIAIFYFMKTRMDAAKKHIRSSNEKSFQYLLDALKGFVEANVYNRNYFFLNRFVSFRKKFSKYLFESISIQSIPPRIIEVFAVLGLFILIAIAKWSGSNDSAMLVTISAFMAAAYKIIPGIVKIINALGQIKAYAFSMDDLVQNNEDVKTTAAKAAIPGIQSIHLEKISFSYGKSMLLNDFYFAINKGDFAGITGASGKGKTTVFNLILGFLKPVTGNIFINNVPVEGKAIKDFWPLISYVRQQSFFIHDTILRNITLEEEGYNNETLAYALKISGLDELVNSFTEGLNKVITENGKNISGGQQQRIAIARAIYKNADLILLDEPFNELDEKSVIPMLDHFRELTKQGKIVIMITHDSKSLSWCNHIISLDEKR
jgi:ABC-type bacteriocin/lantibiotic exporter with double-glycine peptidase domain